MHFTEILSLAARAWHEIKDPKDPEFNDCTLTHRENLGAAAKAVVDSGQAFSVFDRVVLRLYLADKEAKSEADKILAANPTLHGDEVMRIASGTPHPLRPSPYTYVPNPASTFGRTNVNDALLKSHAEVGHAEDAQREAAKEEFQGVESESIVAPVELKGSLPKDFPSHDLLHDAGINTYTQLLKQRDSEQGLEDVTGIGPVAAEKITARLVEDSQTKEN